MIILNFRQCNNYVASDIQLGKRQEVQSPRGSPEYQRLHTPTRQIKAHI